MKTKLITILILLIIGGCGGYSGTKYNLEERPMTVGYIQEEKTYKYVVFYSSDGDYSLGLYTSANYQIGDTLKIIK